MAKILPRSWPDSLYMAKGRCGCLWGVLRSLTMELKLTGISQSILIRIYPKTYTTISHGQTPRMRFGGPEDPYQGHPGPGISLLFLHDPWTDSNVTKGLNFDAWTLGHSTTISCNNSTDRSIAMSFDTDTPEDLYYNITSQITRVRLPASQPVMRVCGGGRWVVLWRKNCYVPTQPTAISQ